MFGVLGQICSQEHTVKSDVYVSQNYCGVLKVQENCVQNFSNINSLINTDWQKVKRQKLVCIISEWSTSGHPTCVYLHLLVCVVPKCGDLSWNVLISTHHGGLALCLLHFIKLFFFFAKPVKTQNFKNEFCLSFQTNYFRSTFVLTYLIKHIF